ncbi:response regulator [Histidinibacterium lentulum]|nr:response regulator [Histidinibacterium lentulum]
MSFEELTADRACLGPILILEDESLIALDFETFLEGEGHAVLGPFRSPDQALEALESRTPGVAILDANLGGETSGEVARALEVRGVPYLYVTGGTVDFVGSSLPPGPVLQKPVNLSEMLSALHGLAQERRGR